MSLADEWHDPRGPEPLRVGDGQTSIDLWKDGYRAALDERLRELDELYVAAAQAAGLSDEQIAAVLGALSQS